MHNMKEQGKSDAMEVEAKDGATQDMLVLSELGCLAVAVAGRVAAEMPELKNLREERSWDQVKRHIQSKAGNLCRKLLADAKTGELEGKDEATCAAWLYGLRMDLGRPLEEGKLGKLLCAAARSDGLGVASEQVLYSVLAMNVITDTHPHTPTFESEEKQLSATNSVAGASKCSEAGGDSDDEQSVPNSKQEEHTDMQGSDDGKGSVTENSAATRLRTGEEHKRREMTKDLLNSLRCMLPDKEKASFTGGANSTVNILSDATEFIRELHMRKIQLTHTLACLEAQGSQPVFQQQNSAVTHAAAGQVPNMALAQRQTQYNKIASVSAHSMECLAASGVGWNVVGTLPAGQGTMSLKEGSTACGRVLGQVPFPMTMVMQAFKQRWQSSPGLIEFANCTVQQTTSLEVMSEMTSVYSSVLTLPGVVAGMELCLLRHMTMSTTTNGRVISIVTSTMHDSAPLKPDTHRGCLSPSGFIFEPTSDGKSSHICVLIDLSNGWVSSASSPSQLLMSMLSHNFTSLYRFLTEVLATSPMDIQRYNPSVVLGSPLPNTSQVQQLAGHQNMVQQQQGFQQQSIVAQQQNIQQPQQQMSQQQIAPLRQQHMTLQPPPPTQQQVATSAQQQIIQASQQMAVSLQMTTPQHQQIVLQQPQQQMAPPAQQQITLQVSQQMAPPAAQQKVPPHQGQSLLPSNQHRMAPPQPPSMASPAQHSQQHKPVQQSPAQLHADAMSREALFRAPSFPALNMERTASVATGDSAWDVTGFLGSKTIIPKDKIQEQKLDAPGLHSSINMGFLNMGLAQLANANMKLSGENTSSPILPQPQSLNQSLNTGSQQPLKAYMQLMQPGQWQK